jgi:hypothetical protein
MLLQGSAHKVFEDAARAIDEVEVFQTSSTDAAKAAGLNKEGLVVVKTFEGEEMTSVYPDKLTDKDAVRNFVKAEKVSCGPCSGSCPCRLCCSQRTLRCKSAVALYSRQSAHLPAVAGVIR